MSISSLLDPVPGEQNLYKLTLDPIGATLLNCFLLAVFRRPQRSESGGGRTGSHLRRYRRRSQVPQESQLNLWIFFQIVDYGVAVLVIRIRRIRTFLGYLDLLVRGRDPDPALDPDPSLFS